MNLAEISKLPASMQRQALADQSRASAARERIMAQAKINPEWKALETSGKPYAEMQRDGSWHSLPAKSPKKAVSDAMQAILPQCAGLKQPKAKAPKQDESRMQQEIIRWFSLNSYEWQLEEELLMAFPLQGKRTARNGARMKAEGMRKGTPDMLLAVPRGDCCGLWIELKTAKGYLNPNQKVMLARLTKAGFATVVTRSVEETCHAIRSYLNLKLRST